MTRPVNPLWNYGQVPLHAVAKSRCCKERQPVQAGTSCHGGIDNTGLDQVYASTALRHGFATEGCMQRGRNAFLVERLG
jgi:hypothetical protein